MSKNKESVKAKPSTKGNATSGKIIVKAKGRERVIKAVVFTSGQSQKLSEAVDKAYSAKRASR